MLKGAIFDMDGLLFDTEKFYKISWVETAKKLNLPPYEQLAFEATGCGGKKNLLELINKFYPDFDAEVYLKVQEDSAFEMMRKNLTTMPGVEEILKFFKSKNVLMAVASSSLVKVVEDNLNRAGLRDFFSATVGGDQIVDGKPSPEIFLLAAEKINLPPEDCYVFEDSYNGIRGAKAAGCLPVMIPDTLQPTEEMRKLCGGIYPSLTHALQAIQSGVI